MNGKEIARFLGIAPMTAWQRLSRASSQLRKEMVAMMDTAFKGKRLPGGFTLRIVEAIKRIKIQPMPRTTGLPWGLPLATGIIVTVLSLNPHVSMTSDIAMPAGSPLSAEAKVLETGEIPVDILETSEISIIASKQGDGDNGYPGPQNTFSMAPGAGEGIWTRKVNMPAPSSGLSTGVVNGIIYAIGGGLSWPGGPFLSSVVAYDPETDTWTKKADMPTARRGLSVSVVDGIVYAIGGYNGTDLSTVEAYDPVTDTWTKKADMPTARDWLSTSVVDGIIYAIGGQTGHRAVVDLFLTVEAYDPAKDTWTKKADMPTARKSPSTSVVDGIIYAIGGWGGGLNFSTVEAYDPATDTWTNKEDMPTGRHWLTTSVVNGLIYAIGGWIGGEDGHRVSAVEAYDPATDTWAKKADMPNGGRAALSARTVNGYIYAIGGWDVAATATVEEFDPEFIAVKPSGKLPTKWGEIK